MIFDVRQWTEYVAFADFALLISLVVFGLTMFKSLPVNMRVFMSYLVVVLLVESLAKFQYYILHQHNIYLLHIYIFFEFLCLSLYFKETLRLSPMYRRRMSILVVIVSGLLFLYSADSLFWHQERILPENFQLYPKVVTSLLTLFFCALFFIQLVGAPGIDRVMFWMNAGVLVYFSGSFVIFIAIHKLVNTHIDDSIILWLVNALLTMAFYLMILKAFLIHRKSWKKVQYG